MTPERAADLTTRWVRWYTRRLPAPVAERLADEIRAGLRDHIAHERACGTSDRRTALSVLSRLVRGVAADTVWRHRVRPWIGDLMKTIAIAVVVIAIGVAAMAYAQEDDSPGLGMIGLVLILGSIGVTARSVYRRRKGAGRR
ncbi:hypothetical protein GCM10009557_66620 [Virgisporangium ochraceum]